MSNMQNMLRQFPHPGKIEWIGIRPAKKADPKVVKSVIANPNEGLKGDHYSGQGGNRHVTLIQAENLSTVAQLLKRAAIDPSLTRRNIVVSQINLLALLEHKVRIGEEVILEITGHCHPCSRMEENLGRGGYNAIRHFAGITAKVIQGGEIKLGDTLVPEW